MKAKFNFKETRIAIGSLGAHEINSLMSLDCFAPQNIVGKNISFIHPRAVSPGKSVCGKIVCCSQSNRSVSVKLSNDVMFWPNTRANKNSVVSFHVSKIINPVIT